MTLKPRSDWLLKFRISFAIRLRATRAGFVPKDIIVTGMNELNCLSVLAYATTAFHLRVGGWRWIFTNPRISHLHFGEKLLISPPVMVENLPTRS